METLDLLITKFKAYKEELEKNSSPLLHDTVEGFMTGLKGMPKGSAERGKFITSHMNHGPFLNALSAHPEGKKMHGMLTNHLNSKANAGFTPGATQVVAKGEEDIDDELEKAYMSPLRRWGPSKPVINSSRPAPAAAPAKPTGSDKIAAVSKEPIHGISEKQGKTPAAPAPKLTGLDRIRAESQRPIEAMDAKVKKDEDMDKGLFGAAAAAPKKPFTPSFKGHSEAIKPLSGASTNASGVTTERSFDPLRQETSKKKYISMPFGKTVNGSYSPSANSAGGGGESMQMSENGQWNLNKGDYGMGDSGKALSAPAGAPAPVAQKPKFKSSDLQIKNGKLTAPPGALTPSIKKDEDGRSGSETLCSKCHAKKCQCGKDGVLVD